MNGRAAVLRPERPGDLPEVTLLLEEGTSEVDAEHVLDEVGALSATLQAKLLQVLRDGVVEPLGSSQGDPIDVRFLLSTRENLAALVEQDLDA